MKAMRPWAAAGSLWVLTTLAVAGDVGDTGEPPTPPSFAEVDTNGDQYIDADEMLSFMQQRIEERRQQFKGDFHKPGGFGGRRFNPIEKADTDGDGMLNETEYLAFIAKMQERYERMPRERGLFSPDEA